MHASHSSPHSNETIHFTKQYASVYFSRLTQLRESSIEKATQYVASMATSSTAAAPSVCRRILDLVTNTTCVITGILYKDMKKKPSILQEYSKPGFSYDAHRTPSVADGVNYRSDGDTLFLEDEFGRIALGGSEDQLHVQTLSSGVVVSVLGRETVGGTFDVERIFVAGFKRVGTVAGTDGSSAAGTDGSSAAGTAAETVAETISENVRYLVCVSGLNVGHPAYDPGRIDLLAAWISNMMMDDADRIHILIAGNSMHRIDKYQNTDPWTRTLTPTANLVRPVTEFDRILAQLATIAPVTLMPGDQDPTNFSLPQQPMHTCLFPRASHYNNICRTTNPCELKMAQTTILATSGQNITDLAKYCFADTHLDLMTKTLEWGCIAPTAPDTLACYPFRGRDPFVLQHMPHIYIAGNQPQFGTKLAHINGDDQCHSRLVSLPSFTQTGIVACVDLHSPTFDITSTQLNHTHIQTA